MPDPAVFATWNNGPLHFAWQTFSGWPSEYLCSEKRRSSMRNTRWLLGMSSEQLVLMRNIAEAINRTSTKTFDSRLAAVEIELELERRVRRSVQQFDDSSGNEDEGETWCQQKKRQRHRRSS
jgi:hypothetical protein